MQRRVSTYVYADDPILQAGVISQLRMRAEIDVVESGDLNGVDVGIAVADTLDDETIRILRSLKKAGVGYTILVMSAIDDSTVVTPPRSASVDCFAAAKRHPMCWSARSRRSRPGTASSLRTCSATCWARWAGCSVRCSRRVDSPSPGCRIARFRCCG